MWGLLPDSQQPDLIWVSSFTDAAGGQSPVDPWVVQVVTLAVALVGGWFSLRGKRTEVSDGRQARFEQRIDAELDDQRALASQWREAWKREHELVLRYERYLRRHGIDPETGELIS